MLNKLVKTNDDYALTIARFVLGVLFFVSWRPIDVGLFGGHGLRGSMDFFTHQLGFRPLSLSWLSVPSFSAD